MTSATRGIVNGKVIRLSMQMHGCAKCCMYVEDHQCGIATRNDLSCLNGSFEFVPPSEHTDEEKTALVTAHLTGEEP